MRLGVLTPWRRGLLADAFMLDNLRSMPGAFSWAVPDEEPVPRSIGGCPTAGALPGSPATHPLHILGEVRHLGHLVAVAPVGLVRPIGRMTGLGGHLAKSDDPLAQNDQAEHLPPRPSIQGASTSNSRPTCRSRADRRTHSRGVAGARWRAVRSPSCSRRPRGDVRRDHLCRHPAPVVHRPAVRLRPGPYGCPRSSGSAESIVNCAGPPITRSPEREHCNERPGFSDQIDLACSAREPAVTCSLARLTRATAWQRRRSGRRLRVKANRTANSCQALQRGRGCLIVRLYRQPRRKPRFRPGPPPELATEGFDAVDDSYPVAVAHGRSRDVEDKRCPDDLQRDPAGEASGQAATQQK